MAEPLKNSYGPEIPRKIAAMIADVYPQFDSKAFLKDVLSGYEELELMPRGRHIGQALHRYLPRDFEHAVDVLIASLGPPMDKTEGNGMTPFLYMPHAFFVSGYGLEYFEASMRAQYEITQRFTAEFSIRPFIERYPQQTQQRLRTWARDPSRHVRRLVSEGTRPRLPWASRLRAFQKDPRPVLQLLELLKDDPEIYVRRSVANNLNDIGKDNPDILVETAQRWLQGASKEREALVRHALRSLVKQGHPGALGVLGYGHASHLTIKHVNITPSKVTRGDAVKVAFDVINGECDDQSALIDVRIHFVKANGQSSPKVFKLKTVKLAPGETAQLAKRISLQEMTTRKHYCGEHTVEVLLNGRPQLLGSFHLVEK